MTMERRLHPRATVGRTAHIQVKGQTVWERVLLVDISEGGGGIRAEAELPLQSEVRLRFTLPTEDEDGIELVATALVVRAARETRAGKDLPVRIGLHFVSFTGAGLDTVRRWVWAGST